MKNIAIVGGGAGGVLSAISAAKKGASVCLYEHGDALLRKLVITGNGKGNLSNLQIMASDYHTSSSCGISILENMLCKVSPSKLRDEFASLGLLTRVKDRLIYPYNESAKCVRDCLENALLKLGVEVKLGADLYHSLSLLPDGRFQIEDRQFDSVILACGGKSYKKTGSDGSGIEIAKKLGHKCIPLEPALSRLFSDLPDIASLSGLRVKARISYKDMSEYGEIQFVDKGLSGICVFQLSGQIGHDLSKGTAPIVLVDFMPEYNEEELAKLLKESAGDRTSHPSFKLWPGILPKSLMEYICKMVSLKQDVVSEIAYLIKHFSIPITGIDKLENAQVTRGGICLDEIHSNFESKIVPNLFLVGEMLDVDGPCGGYNLHFAFASGIIAGEEAC